MKLHVTFPGRFGDIIWSLPCVRAISEAAGEPVDFSIAGEFASMVPLLKAGAPYLAEVTAIPEWSLTPPNEWEAPIPHLAPINLGYRGWPDQPLPLYIYEQAKRIVPGIMAPLDLERPWLTLPPLDQISHRLTIGFSDCWFELKVGILGLLQRADWRFIAWTVMPPAGSRWVKEAYRYDPVEWLEAGYRIAESKVFFGDCSALHVLACSFGKSCVLVEPMEARHDPIFWPFGMDGPRVYCVKGNDGKPTFDSRHCLETLEKVIALQFGSRATAKASESVRA